jgi:hypothetical protein
MKESPEAVFNAARPRPRRGGDACIARAVRAGGESRERAGRSLPRKDRAAGKAGKRPPRARPRQDGEAQGAQQEPSKAILSGARSVQRMQ